jgi:DNA-binding beta-propeller fold protein YncE
MVKLVNKAKMDTATTGTGIITLNAAYPAFQSFAAAGVSDGDTIRYGIEENNNWEIGTGVYTAAGTTLTRVVTESSNAGSPIDLQGNAVVYVTAAVGDFLEPDNNLSDVDDAAAALGNLGLTATAAELNTLDGITATTEELNTLDGITATTEELNTLDGITATTQEINYLSGVTSNIQAQLGSISVTAGTLTKSFISGETSSISLPSALSPAPVVSVIKEVPQTGVVSKGAWDVTTTGANYDRLDSAYDTTLTPTDISDLATSSDANSSYQYQALFPNPYGFCFGDNGTKLYVIETSSTDAVYQLNLSTAWDVSTATYASKALSVGAYENSPSGITFKPDGTELYVTGYGNDRTVQYRLSTAWDLSTAAYLGNYAHSIGIDSIPMCVEFNQDGTKMYVYGNGSDRIYVYNITTPWIVMTAEYTGTFFQLDTVGFGQFTFNSDGTAFYTLGNGSSRTVRKYVMSTPYDVTTASLDSSFTITSAYTEYYSIQLKSDETKFYVLEGSATDTISTYTLGNFKKAILAAGSFSSTDVGKTIEGNGGVAVLTATDGSYAEVTPFTDSSTIPAGSWGMFGAVFDATSGIRGSFFSANTWNISTASFNQLFSIAAQELSPQNIFFKPDGTKMYVIGYGGRDVNEYNLSTPWSISTATFVRVFSVSSQEYTPTGVFFKPDGTKMYVTGSSQDRVNEYNLSTAWDISTASFNQLFSIAAQETNPQGLFFKPDGTKMYVIGVFVDNVNEYNLSTAWDVSTASFNQLFSVAAQETSPTGIFFKPDGTKMYVIGETGDYVNEYNLGSITALTAQYTPSITNAGGQIDSTFWLDINSMTTDEAAGDGEVYYAVSTDSRTTWSVIKDADGVRPIVRNNAGTWEYNEATSIVGDWDISTAAYAQNFSVGGQDIFPVGVFFKPDGTKMYVLGNTGDDVNEYNLSTPWDVSTASFLQTFSVQAQENDPRGFFFKPDGTKMYVIGNNGDDVNEYNLSTPWSISTATFVRVFSVSSQDAFPQSIFFKPDGTKMYVVGTGGVDVNEYNLSTPWDILTASYAQNFSVSAQDSYPTDVFFKPDGTKMYIVGNTGDDVNEYNLSTPWDISTASFSQLFSVVAQETGLRGFFFKPDGTKMYVIGSTGDAVNEYDLGSLSYTTSETWVSATTNTELAALQEALTEVSVNRMDKAQLEAVTDPNHYTLGDTLDLMIGLYLGSTSESVPSSDGVSINYDAEVLNKGAILGTDYDYDFPDSTTVRITSNATQNLKIRVV